MLAVVNKNIEPCIGVAVALLCTIYMAQWLSMPLYADEVADRLKVARLFHDGGMQYGLYGLCFSNFKTIPLFFYPAASFFALIDAVPLYLTVRIIPMVVLVFALVVFFYYGLNRKTESGALFLLSGFIGVAGSGLVLARPEFSLLFMGSGCLWVYGLLREDKRGPRTIIVALAMLVLAFQIAVFHHVEALIYLPLVALLCFRLTDRLSKFPRATFAASGIFVLYSAYLCVVTGNVSCPEWPAVEAHRAHMTFTGQIFAPSGPGFFAVLADRLNPMRIWKPFIFFNSYVPDYLPGLPPESKRLSIVAVNQLARFFALFNMAGLVSVAVVAPYLWLREAAKSRDWKKHLASPKLFIALLAVPYVLLCLYDQQHGFYRPFHINLVAAMLLTALFSRNVSARSRLIKNGILALGCLAALTCLGSTFVAGQMMSPQLFSRQSKTDVIIPFALDWRVRNKAIESLAHTCGITGQTQNIIVDNTTYDALKQHHHLIHLDYLFTNDNTSYALTLKDFANSTTVPQAILTQCSRFSTLHLHPQASFGLHDPNPLMSYCCARF